MGWNDSGGGRNQDPWKGGGRQDQGPPDLDELFKTLSKKFDAWFGGGNGSGRNSNGAGGAGGIGALIILVVIAGVFWVGNGFFKVYEAERALILRFGEKHKIVGPGLNWRPPIIDEVMKVDTQQVSSLEHEASILTKDLDIVELEIKVQYKVSDPESFFLEARTPLVALKQATESALRHVAGEMEMESIINLGREQVAPEVQLMLQRYLDFYETGLLVTKVNLERADPPAPVEDAFDDVTKARQDRERLVSEAEAYRDRVIPNAEGQALRLEEEANAYKEQRIAQARGEADRFEKLLSEYRKAPEVTRSRLYLESIENVLQKTSKVLLDTEGGQNLTYLPLDKLMSNNGGVGESMPLNSTTNTLRNTLDSAVNRSDVRRIGRSLGEGR